MSLATELQDVCGRLDRRDITRDQFVSACTRLMTLHVACTRAGIWTFPEAAGGPVQHCLGIYDALIDRVFTVPDFSVGMESFVEVLRTEGQLVADDTRIHPGTRELWTTILQPQGVQSLLAVPFSVNGQLAGVFTCSSVGERVHFASGQLALLKRIAIRASLSLASATSFTLATMPAPLMELPPLTDKPAS
jgi:GAF domain-containing protein